MCRTQHQTSSMGLYYVGYRLAERCWHVSAGKCAANSPAKGKFWRTGLPQITFQVSAQRKKSPICFNGGPERITEQFLIAVVNLDTDEPEVYVFTADDAKERLVQRGKSNQHYIQLPAYDTEEFRERWDKLEP